MGRKKEITDETLLEIARGCFLEHGSSLATSVIAKAAGVSQATLFNRFGSKREMMIKSLRASSAKSQELFTLLDSLPDDRPMPDQLAEIAWLAYHFFHDLIPGMMVMATVGVTFQEIFRDQEIPAPFRGRMKFMEMIARAQSKGLLGDVAPEVFVGTFMGSIRAIVSRGHMGLPVPKEKALQEELTQLIHLLWNGCHPQTNK